MPCSPRRPALSVTTAEFLWFDLHGILSNTTPCAIVVYEATSLYSGEWDKGDGEGQRTSQVEDLTET